MSVSEAKNVVINPDSRNPIERAFIPERFVIALEMANAVQTPLAPPDMSSPSSSFANLSFINSTSATINRQ
jgi:hypothetical protein